MDRSSFDRYLDQLLQPSRFKDYCPNGLQVEGASEVAHIVTGVTASQALLDAAVAAGADTVIVHHGYFWRGEDPRVLGTRRRRLATLLQHEINLFAYHLPLDVHAEVGNNVQLGRLFGWPVTRTAGENGLIAIAELSKPLTVDQIARHLGKTLGRKPLVVGDLPTSTVTGADRDARSTTCIAWCTGAAQDALEEAAFAGASVFVSGEISERTTHLAREMGVVYMAAGHHATERYGIQALGQRIKEDLGLRVEFIDDPNPV